MFSLIVFGFVSKKIIEINSLLKQNKNQNEFLLIFKIEFMYSNHEILPDDLEMDIVAALEAQHLQRENANGIAINENDIIINTSSSANSSPKELRKIDAKRRWKNWGWKYSPGSKTCSIEEEPESPKKTSHQSSPSSSPKHKKTNDIAQATNIIANLIQTSPLRRKTTGQKSSASRADIRSSAGARLYQTIEDSLDESGDELQALLANGRPASVHIVPISPSTKPLLNDM